MASNDEVQLSMKHEEILGKRSALLQQMEVCYQQQKAKRKQQAVMSEAAHERNAEILEDFQKVEQRLQTRPLLHPDILTLQVCYWASVEQNLSQWDLYLLGKGSAPVSQTAPSHQRQNTTRLNSSPVQNGGKPPLPKP
ncbi:centrosomal protein 15 [Brachyhypopomus gauderio]|uniref:centrosomal protein 15 n=1 Tax=Brachyhypopomus gauderio TaxID=698409 RepID=UPI0040435899